jgi:hypothetical protein
MKYVVALFLMITVSLACDKGTGPDNGVNHPPVITSPTSTTAIKDSLFQYFITVFEPDNQEVYLSLLASPEWLALSGENIRGITPWESDNTFFTISASDGELSNTMDVLVTVSENEAFYVGLRPRENYIQVDEYFTLILGINSVEDLFGISFDLVFDPSLATVESAYIPSSSILEAAKSIMFFEYLEDGISVSASRIQSEMDDDVSGSGPLVAIDYLASASGFTAVEIQNVMIIDETGEVNPDLPNLLTKPATILIY